MSDNPVADVVDLMHRYAVCQRDFRARITTLGPSYFGDLHEGDIVEVYVGDEDVAVLTVGRALVRKQGDEWELVA